MITIALQDSLKSGCLIPLALFIFLKIALTICSLLWSYMNFWIICSSPVENVILIGIALNLYIALGTMAILTISILPIHKHWISFYLFVYSLIWDVIFYTRGAHWPNLAWHLFLVHSMGCFHIIKWFQKSKEE